MSQPFPKNYKDIADGMGIALWQRFSTNEASLFLRCQTADVEKLASKGKIGFINVPGGEKQFFGYQLLEYVLENTRERKTQTVSSATQSDRILRIKEVTEMIGLSRTTIWRMERKGEFPTRVQLGVGSVGWRASELERWIGR